MFLPEHTALSPSPPPTHSLNMKYFVSFFWNKQHAVLKRVEQELSGRFSATCLTSMLLKICHTPQKSFDEFKCFGVLWATIEGKHLFWIAVQK